MQAERENGSKVTWQERKRVLAFGLLLGAVWGIAEMVPSMPFWIERFIDDASFDWRMSALKAALLGLLVFIVILLVQKSRGILGARSGSEGTEAARHTAVDGRGLIAAGMVFLGATAAIRILWNWSFFPPVWFSADISNQWSLGDGGVDGFVTLTAMILVVLVAMTIARARAKSK